MGFELRENSRGGHSLLAVCDICGEIVQDGDMTNILWDNPKCYVIACKKHEPTKYAKSMELSTMVGRFLGTIKYDAENIEQRLDLLAQLP